MVVCTGLTKEICLVRVTSAEPLLVTTNSAFIPRGALKVAIGTSNTNSPSKVYAFPSTNSSSTAHVTSSGGGAGFSSTLSCNSWSVTSFTYTQPPASSSIKIRPNSSFISLPPAIVQLQPHTALAGQSRLIVNATLASVLPWLATTKSSCLPLGTSARFMRYHVSPASTSSPVKLKSFAFVQASSTISNCSYFFAERKISLSEASSKQMSVTPNSSSCFTFLLKIL